ncbi:transcription factor HES-2.2 [Megalobrama amblycephala]|uniref:transcription factor HES-2.2 n=1 Tax=Megalobrama amblycephala TaxID=75352 RepID=UPI002013DBE4|nr:transcription factor HES-2.2 [Megalobrama amblycephala]
MTPNATAVSALSYAPRTVAMRKEANELRKTLKPLLEKKRRARINESLNRLKALILPLTGKDNCRYSKLEKADILEMTVRFLTDIQSTPSKDGAVSFKEGYTTCLQRVSARLPQTNLDTETRHRVNEFIQRSMMPKTPGCQNCCAQSSRMMSQIQQKLLNLKSSSSRIVNPEKNNAAILSQPQPVPLITDDNVWRPW